MALDAMKEKMNVIGKKWGYLTGLYRLVLPRFGRPKIAHVVLQCECGSVIKRTLADLNNGDIRSCGCKKGQLITEALTQHGMADTAIYNRYCAMLRRCYTPTEKAYANYGARGIKVCDRWRESFQNFLDDMGFPPTDKHSIDRINNDGDYEPSNCRWATVYEQAYNKRNTRTFTYQGRSFHWKDCKQVLGLSKSTISKYTRMGLSIEEIKAKKFRKRAAA